MPIIQAIANVINNVQRNAGYYRIICTPLNGRRFRKSKESMALEKYVPRKNLKRTRFSHHSLYHDLKPRVFQSPDAETASQVSAFFTAIVIAIENLNRTNQTLMENFQPDFDFNF